MAQKRSVLGIDIAKLVFHVVGMDDTRHMVLRKRLMRSEFLPFIAQLSPLRTGIVRPSLGDTWGQSRGDAEGGSVMQSGHRPRETVGHGPGT